jgi:L-methionine (R)-S-oxide reductase
VEADLRWIVANGGERDRALARAAEAIRRVGGYRWVGIYDVDNDEIRIAAWTGPELPAHPRFPASEGLCGAAAASRETVVVGDVRHDPRYLTTFGTTRSEIVVPVISDGRVVGLVDVESDRVDAFGTADQKRLERAAAVIEPLWRVR